MLYMVLLNKANPSTFSLVNILQLYDKDIRSGVLVYIYHFGTIALWGLCDHKEHGRILLSLHHLNQRELYKRIIYIYVAVAKRIFL